MVHDLRAPPLPQQPRPLPIAQVRRRALPQPPSIVLLLLLLLVQRRRRHDLELVVPRHVHVREVDPPSALRQPTRAGQPVRHPVPYERADDASARAPPAARPPPLPALAFLERAERAPGGDAVLAAAHARVHARRPPEEPRAVRTRLRVLLPDLRVHRRRAPQQATPLRWLVRRRLRRLRRGAEWWWWLTGRSGLPCSPRRLGGVGAVCRVDAVKVRRGIGELLGMRCRILLVPRTPACRGRSLGATVARDGDRGRELDASLARRRSHADEEWARIRCAASNLGAEKDRLSAVEQKAARREGGETGA
ncbi:hypothetical protein BD414DRAFT_302001 [Trametes punicea]|nr:hypothetical protein BD414DRAFT_302001 [Trametes punicea]